MEDKNIKKGWEIKKLGEVCESDLGKTLNQAKDTGNLYPYLCAINVLWDKFDFSTVKYTRFEKSELERYSVRKGDLLICEGGDIGRSAIWDKEESMQYQNALHRVRFNGSIEPRFCLLYFRFLKNSGILDLQYGKGVTIKHLVKTSLLSIPIPIPPLSEQERIVEELDCLSGVIEKKKEQLKELDALAQSIFYEMFGNPMENDRGWEVKTIGDVCVLKSGDSSANNTSVGTLPYVKVGDMNIDENIPYITTSSTFVSKSENIKGIFPIGTTIFPKRGGAIYTNKKRLTVIEICCDLNTMGVIPMNDVLSLYIYYYFVLLDFGELCNGAAIPQINNKDIAPLKVCVPPLSLQQEFASKIESIDKQKELIRKSIKEVEMLFNSRMDYYFG